LPLGGKSCYFTQDMSTLAEIETAVKSLSRREQEELFDFLAGQIKQTFPATSAAEDSFAALSGAFSGPHEATGRNAEEILYGKGA
jgi:hypothetical protein